MNFKKTSIVYFSPTESTKKIMNLMKTVIDENAEEIDMTDFTQTPREYTFSKEELLLVGVPVYGGRVPEVAVNKVRLLKGNETPAIIVTSYGNRDYDDALLELKDLLQGNGFFVIGAGAFVTEHSIMHSFGKGRPDEADQNEILEFALKAKNKMQSMKDANEEADLFVKGNPKYKEYHGIPFHPQTDKQCDQCGICASKCPVSAIPFEDPSQTKEEICISCMRCIQVCPKKARSLSKLKLLVATKKFAAHCQEPKKNETFI